MGGYHTMKRRQGVGSPNETAEAAPGQAVSPRLGKKYPVEILTDDETKALIRACSSRAPSGVRNRALLVVLYRGGLRVSEALALKPKDLDRVKGTVRVLMGKGSKARTVGLDPGAFAIIERWLDVRKSLRIDARCPVFCTITEGKVYVPAAGRDRKIKAGQPLTATYVQVMFKRLGERAGIDKRVHPHCLRHTHAAELMAEGKPINVISKQLGHANIAITSRYLDHLAPQDVIDAMQSREWSL